MVLGKRWLFLIRKPGGNSDLREGRKSPDVYEYDLQFSSRALLISGCLNTRLQRSSRGMDSLTER